MKRVLVDTSVWIDFFHGTQNPHVGLLDKCVADESARVCGLILCELLPLGRTAQERKETEEYLRSVGSLDDPADLWQKVLASKARCKGIGISGIGIPDLILCAVANHNECPILTRDNHFTLLQKALPDLEVMNP